MDLSINERIRYYRRQKKFNQTQLGEKLGLKCSTYSQMERQGNITVDMAIEIAKVLGINPDLIIYGHEKSNKLDFTATKPQTISLSEKKPFIEIYGEPVVKIQEEKLENTLTATEESIIKIYRGWPKEKQKELFNFVNALDKK